MNSRERVRSAIRHQQPDRTPAAFEAVGTVVQKLLKHYGYTTYRQLEDRFQIDITGVGPAYTGPELKSYTDADGNRVEESYWGHETTFYWTGQEYNGITSKFPLQGVDTLEKLAARPFPSPDWFDYEGVKRQCENAGDRAVIIGHEGPFQMVTFLMEMSEFFMLMIDAPEVAHGILDRMVAFELEYYERILQAADGRVDILRPHDDYGTQISLLFSLDMWREYFKENTKKLADLAHRYGAFYQQHSCGCVGAIIPELIECGVDVLEPLQKVKGLEPETLQESYGGRIAFHGGIDTQKLLPYGTVEEVRAEVRRYIDVLGGRGGYILMASQGFEGDVPLENIEAVYSVER